MQKHIIEALNAAIPLEYTDYIDFLKNYSGLNQEEKAYYLNIVLNHPRSFFKHMKIFLKSFTGANNPSQSEKIKFASFLKTMNDLCFNNPVLLNLKGDMKHAWELHFIHATPNEELNTKFIHSTLLNLMQDIGFSIQNSTSTANNITDSISKEFIDDATDFIITLGEHANYPLFKDNEQDICMLFMLCQSKFIRFCLQLSLTPVPLNDWFSLWAIELKLVECCAYHIKKFIILLQANIPFHSLCQLAKINGNLLTAMIENAPLVTPLFQDQWLSMESLLSFSKQNRDACKTYLEHPDELASLKAVGIPFSILITGDTYTNCYRTETILSAITLRANFDHLVTHSKVTPETFNSDLKDFQLSDTDFMLACVQSKTFRILIQNPNNIHQLLDSGFAFDALCKNTENLSILLEHKDDIFDLLSQDIPIQLFINWYKLLPLSGLLSYRTALIELKKTGVDLKQFAALSESYPQHALLILKNLNNPHSQWWIKQQLKK